MAEAVFAHQVRAAGLENEIVTDSAGTGDWHVGKPPHQGTRRLLDQNQIEYEHCARLLVPDDLNDFDYVVTMDNANLRDAQSLGKGRAKIVPLLTYAPHLGIEEVPDPYYSGGFEGVYAMVSEATASLLAAIRREHHFI